MGRALGVFLRSLRSNPENAMSDQVPGTWMKMVGWGIVLADARRQGLRRPGLGMAAGLGEGDGLAVKRGLLFPLVAVRSKLGAWRAPDTSSSPMVSEQTELGALHSCRPATCRTIHPIILARRTPVGRWKSDRRQSLS